MCVCVGRERERERDLQDYIGMDAWVLKYSAGHEESQFYLSANGDGCFELQTSQNSELSFS